jgi:hypothetical protein
MRAELLNPHSDKPRLDAVIRLVELIYSLHEAGEDYTLRRTELSELVGRPVSKFDIDSAFGSVSAPTFARDLLPTAIPTDLSVDEMVDLVERISRADGTEFQIGYWVRCIGASTGDDHVSDRIFFGDFKSALELVEAAIAAGNRKKED